MGIDTAQIFNHNIQYQNGAELLQQLQLRLGKPVLNCIYDNDNKLLTELPNDFDGYVIYTNHNTTIDYSIEKLDLLDFDLISTQKIRGHFYINQFVIYNSLPEIFRPRWQFNFEMCNLIKDFGLRNFEDYDKEELSELIDHSFGYHLLKERIKMQPSIAKFGSSKMISFCSDYHDVYLDHIANNWSFEDFVSWGKKEFIYVEFKDLHLFDFPEKKPDYYNVFIYDDFSDLK